MTKKKAPIRKLTDKQRLLCLEASMSTVMETIEHMRHIGNVRSKQLSQFDIDLNAGLSNLNEHLKKLEQTIAKTNVDMSNLEFNLIENFLPLEPVEPPIVEHKSDLIGVCMKWINAIKGAK